MYLYPVDNAVTYTSEDLVLFRSSPFACWMERLTLENPDHGVQPDQGSSPPRNTGMRQDDMAETLRAEGKDVVLVDWDREEPWRRSATLDAMRRGVDFIVNGQLAVGPLSGSANLLMRTSGYSQLGDYLYIPCDTQADATLDSAFRLCFLADLLHGVQGQLPPQMLVIRGGSDLVPLQTEDHIYYYRAVKQRFMEAMSGFRKHRMPDPAQSSHFGRWWECARDVLRQRALRREPTPGSDLPAADLPAADLPEADLPEVDLPEVDIPEMDIPEEREVAPRVAAVAVARGSAAPAYDLDEVHGGRSMRRIVAAGAPPGAAVLSPGGQAPAGLTLVEQARMLAAPPAPEPVRREPPPRVEPPESLARPTGAGDAAPTADAAFANLEFIGSRSHRRPLIGRDFPAATPREERVPEKKAHPLDSTAYKATPEYPAVDSDSAPGLSPAAGNAAVAEGFRAREQVRRPGPGPRPVPREDPDQPEPPPFSASLITSGDFEE